MPATYRVVSTVQSPELDSMVLGFLVVMAAEPAEQGGDFRGIPGGVPLTGQCAGGVSSAVPYELIDRYASGVTRFERDRGEPESGDQELDQAMLHREQLMRAVGALTESYDLGVGEEVDQLLQVRCSPIWFRRGQRHS